MVNNSSNILFIVEGEADEGKLLRKLNKIIDTKNAYSIYAFKTTIHEMYDIYLELKDDDSFTLQGLLKEYSDSNTDRSTLSNRFKSVYMIFDFDPHYQKYSPKIINEMFEFFNDSREFGKLYLNYPMIQSYRHMSKMPDPDFKESKVTHSECLRYKQIVGDESDYTDLNKYSFVTIINFIYHHYSKLNYIIKGTYECGSKDEYLKESNEKLKLLLKIQTELFDSEDHVFIISSSIFYILDLLPDTFFKKYSNLLF